MKAKDESKGAVNMDKIRVNIRKMLMVRISNIMEHEECHIFLSIYEDFYNKLQSKQYM